MWKEGRRGGQRGEPGPKLRGLTDHSKEFKFILGVVGNHGGWEELRTGKLFTINVQAALKRKVRTGGVWIREEAITMFQVRHGGWSQAGGSRGRGHGWVLKCSEG